MQLHYRGTLSVGGATKIANTFEATGTTHLVGVAQATATFRVGPPGNFDSVNGIAPRDATRLVLQSGGSGDSTSRKFGIEFHTTDNSSTEFNASLIESGWPSGQSAWDKAFISFYTHATDKNYSETMTLMGNKVGIGSSSPATTLDVVGTSKITQTLSLGGFANLTAGLYVSSNASADSDGIEFRHSNGTQGVGIGHNTIYATGGNPNQELGLKGRGNSGVVSKDHFKVASSLSVASASLIDNIHIGQHATASGDSSIGFISHSSASSSNML